ncbi:TlpA family protein disulfide reductase [Nucisporomicrobium flavum]|uniref:TlpA family protein disulfide reductase n=1 Tax=Nucisporomicrobium flavum TaxID=2785915 RepID=UPI001F3F78BE|nr:thioredoxin family protein [Nucisporomicrobium flavum]
MQIPGLIAVAAVLVVGVAAGMWRRSTDGRVRTVAGVAGDGGSVDGDGSVVRDGRVGGGGSVVRDGRVGDGVPVEGDVHGVRDDPAARRPEPVERIDPELLAELGVRAGEVTLLQFSTAFCAPCRAVRRVSADVAGLLEGVRHVEVDAESHLDAVRALGIWKTPTLLVVGADGRVAKRATGVPGKPHLIAALADLLPPR